MPSDYGGVSDLRIPSNRLWKPDILMYNRWVCKLQFTSGQRAQWIQKVNERRANWSAELEKRMSCSIQFANVTDANRGSLCTSFWWLFFFSSLRPVRMKGSTALTRQTSLLSTMAVVFISHLESSSLRAKSTLLGSPSTTNCVRWNSALGLMTAGHLICDWTTTKPIFRITFQVASGFWWEFLQFETRR